MGSRSLSKTSFVLHLLRILFTSRPSWVWYSLLQNCNYFMGFLTFFSPLFCITFSLFFRFIGRMVGIFLHTFNTATLLRETKLPQILWIGYWKRVLYNVYRKKLLRKNKQVENRTKNLNLFNSPTKTHLMADCLETMEISFKYPTLLLCTCVKPWGKTAISFSF